MVQGRDRIDPEDFIRQAFERVGYRRHINQLMVRLKQEYTRPGRHFHVWQHVLDGIRFLLDRSGVLEYEIAVAYAYHDFVYTPGASDNELRSAYACYRDLIEGGISQRRAYNFFILVMATAHDRDLRNASRKEQMISDIDLISLAKSPDEFEADRARIRQEFSAFSDEQFVAGQKAFFSNMLARPHIFYMWDLHDDFENRARRNVSRLIGV